MVGYMGLEEVVPGSAAEAVADDELENVEWEVRDDAEDPYRPGPSPPDPFDPREFPACVHSDQRGHLQIAIIRQPSSVSV